MTPDQIPAALRDFAAASAQSPDASRSVADLALLLAHLVGEVVEHVRREFDLALIEATKRGAADLLVAGAVTPIGPGEFDELAFPPIQPVDKLLELEEATPEQIAAAQAVSGRTPEEWANLPEIEQWHAINVAAQLAQRQLEA